MKENIYLFSDSRIRKKDNTLCCEKLSPVVPVSGEAENDYEESVLEKSGIFMPFEKPSLSGEKKYIPVESVDAIFTFGTLRFNSRFLYFLSRNFIPMHFFTVTGNYSGSFLPSERMYSGGTLVAQVDFFRDSNKRIGIAAELVAGAAHNALSNLKYYAGRGSSLAEEIERMEELSDIITDTCSIAELMGIEGMIKKIYYGGWNQIFRQPVTFPKREKHPAPNPVNSLISYGNAVVYGVCLSEIYHTRLYPEISYLHEPADARASLVYDIAEVFKPIIADRAVFTVINKNMISEKGFYYKDGACLMKKETKMVFIQAIEKKLASTVEDPETGRSMSYRRLIREECYNLLKHVTGAKPYLSYKSDW
jgi:CRISPR-associated protein Cas1